MKVCLVSTEIFAWGKYGGFGRATRMIGRELVKAGIDVSAIVPLRENQRAEENLDGIKVFGYPMKTFWQACQLFKKVNADIYHSQQPSLATYLAEVSMPGKKHVVTCRDPKGFQDWLMELSRPSVNVLRSLMGFGFENSFLTVHAVQKADCVAICAKFLNEKARHVYRYRGQLDFLATPVAVPGRPLKKDPTPTVCFIARWDKRKRPELFFQLAEKNPRIRFIALGKSQDEDWNRYLSERFGSLTNLEMTGFVNQFESDSLSSVLERSWIMINTATREGLPTSFLEAMAHQCALLSPLDPELVTSRFGYRADEEQLQQGLNALLEHDEWRYRGIAGQQYVKEHYELTKVIEKHIETYKRILAGNQ